MGSMSLFPGSPAITPLAGEPGNIASFQGDSVAFSLSPRARLRAKPPGLYTGFFKTSKKKKKRPTSLNS